MFVGFITGSEMDQVYFLQKAREKADEIQKAQAVRNFDAELEVILFFGNDLGVSIGGSQMKYVEKRYRMTVPL